MRFIVHRKVVQEFIRRKYHFHAYFLALVISLVIVVLGASTPTRAEDATLDTVPPAAPLAVAAVTHGSQVDVTWESAQAGTYPVAGYIISKSVDQAAFTELSRQVELHYSDPNGHAGEVYRVVAYDTQETPLLSPASDLAVAAEPAATVSLATPAPDTLLAPNEIKSVEHPELPPESKTDADTDATLSNEKLSALETSTLAEPDNVIHTLIDQFSRSKENLILRKSQLDPAQREHAAQSCSGQEGGLETLMSSLSENLQMNLIEALARCQLLQ